MKSIAVFGIACAMLAALPSHARTSRNEQMLKLTPETRLEQRCNARAMGAVSRDHKGFKPDEFVAYAFAETAISGAHIKAPGGALRSGGNWYKVSYSCETSPDGMEVRAFTYQLGELVPRKDWDAHFLVP